MNSKNENQIESIIPDSPAHKVGLRHGDIILSINDHPIHDAVDLMYYSKERDPLITIKRGERIIKDRINKSEDENIGIEMKPFQIRRCKNSCMFCFINQLPKGLRKSLYIMDDDYRMSFLYGNYISLSNVTSAEKKRIVQQRLSPLYVSVHTTNGKIRNKLLGNKNAPDILKEIRFFVSHKIKLHAQIVLCPGINDGEELERTVKDLYKFYPYVSSIAVVPVGLTEHGKKKVDLVAKDDAQKVLLIIEKLQKKYLKKQGEAIVYAADEVYLKADADFPPLTDYGDLPQLENGIGMVPLFLHRSRRLKDSFSIPKSRIVTFTGTSFYPILKKIIARINKKYSTDINVIPVENLLFGKTITVTGLLTGRDIISTLIEQIKGDEVLLIPDVALRDGTGVFLDDITVDFISETLHVRTKVIKASFDGLIQALNDID